VPLPKKKSTDRTLVLPGRLVKGTPTNRISRLTYSDLSIPTMEEEPISADVSFLGTLMLALMKEKQETIKTSALRDWSAEAVDFVDATSRASLDKLSDVSARIPGQKSRLTPVISIYS
jgi:hypothetical protein